MITAVAIIITFINLTTPGAKQSNEERNYYAHSNTGIVGSNPTRGTDVRPQFFNA
jgi:hypothetical protein